MKKFLALLLTLALLAGLTACKDTEAASTAQEQHTVTAPTNDATFVYQPDDPAATLPGGESVVLVTGPGGTESGEDAMLWQGIQTFANTYGYTADAQTAAGNTADEAEAALRAAAESGAKLVVCRGDTMGAALYRMQENYPDVHYLLFDSEPHSDDYSAYNTASLVHCVLFQEEQAGYLAGYAAVTDGYTTLGFIGAREVPGIVRYCTGFLQGAEAAAELQGEYVTLQTWFTDTYENNDAITQRMIDWYNNGEHDGLRQHRAGRPRAGQRHQVLQRCRAASAVHLLCGGHLEWPDRRPDREGRLHERRSRAGGRGALAV